METGTLAFSNRSPQEARRAGMASPLPRLPLFKAHIVCETEAHHPAPEAGYVRQLSSALGTCLYLEHVSMWHHIWAVSCFHDSSHVIFMWRK